jgi:hypothetical protein
MSVKDSVAWSVISQQVPPSRYNIILVSNVRTAVKQGVTLNSYSVVARFESW